MASARFRFLLPAFATFLLAGPCPVTAADPPPRNPPDFSPAPAPATGGQELPSYMIPNIPAAAEASVNVPSPLLR